MDYFCRNIQSIAWLQIVDANGYDKLPW